MLSMLRVSKLLFVFLIVVPGVLFLEKLFYEEGRLQNKGLCFKHGTMIIWHIFTSFVFLGLILELKKVVKEDLGFKQFWRASLCPLSSAQCP